MEGTPHLLTDVKFSERRRGYAPEEVDNFLERVSSAVAQLQDKFRDATARAEEADARISEAKRAQTVAEAQVDQLKAELQKASDGGGTPTVVSPAPSSTDPADDAEAASTLLLMAKKTADATIEDARNEAESTVAEAQSRAAELLADAESESTRVRSDAERIAEDLVTEQREVARAEVVALEEMKGVIRADIEALQRHVDREREDLRKAVGRLSDVIDNPAALRVSDAPVGDTPGVDALLAPAAGVEAVDEIDDPVATRAAPSVDGDDEIDVDLDVEFEAATSEVAGVDELSEPAAGIETIDEVDDEVEVEAAADEVDAAGEADDADQPDDADEVDEVDEAADDEADSGEKLFADEPDADVETGPPTEAFQPFTNEPSDASAFDTPKDEDEDKAMRAFFETDFESMEADKRSRWRR